MDVSTYNDLNRTGEVILIESDEEYNVDNLSPGNKTESIKMFNFNDTIEMEQSSNIIISNEIYSNESDTFKNNEISLINDKLLMPKIIAVTGGVPFINTDGDENLDNGLLDETLSDDNDSDYEDILPIKIKHNKIRKKDRLPKNIHIKNRIKRIIRKQIKKNPKQYSLIKSYAKTIRKTRKTHYPIIKRNVRKFNSALPVKVKTNDCHWSSLVCSRRSQIDCIENVRTEIIEQLKIFREKCNKHSDTDSEIVLNKKETCEEKISSDSTSNMSKTTVAENSPECILYEPTDAPCCSKSIYEKPIEQSVCDEVIPTEPSLECSVKSYDKSKYKSLKYRMQFNKCKGNDGISSINDKIPEEHKVQKTCSNSQNIFLKKELNKEEQIAQETGLNSQNIFLKKELNLQLTNSQFIDDIASNSQNIKSICQKIESNLQNTDRQFIDKEIELDSDVKYITCKTETGNIIVNENCGPRLDDVIEKIRALRPKKITEKDDIIAILKSDSVKCHQISPRSDDKFINLNSPSYHDSIRTKKEPKANILPAAPTKIALPDGRIVKPKTLAEKRRLLRREFESEMRSKMQVNDQLLERQILRQKSNNRRTESAEVRERLLYDNAPMTRHSWNRATELQTSNTMFSQQFMMIDGRYVRICGSRGGRKRFLTPPPSASDILHRKSSVIKEKPNKDQQSEFLPGPLSKKHLLIRNPLKIDGVYARKKLPPVFIEVFPKFGRSLEAAAESYLKVAFSNVIDETRAKFAASAVDFSENMYKFAFPLQYHNDQKEILCRLKETDAFLPQKTEISETIKTGISDDMAVVSDMLSDMFSCVENSFLGDSIIKNDPDAVISPKSPEINIKPIVASSEPSAVSHVRKAALELRRLNVTVIEANECASNIAACCKEAYCRLGCVCSSLKCLVFGIKRHCGNVECMFECKCEYTHRLRQKRTLCHNSSSAIDEDDLLELKDRVCSGLAPIEAEFKHAVVVNQDRSVTLVDGDTEKRKRSVKIPKRFDDYISEELPTVIPLTSSPLKNTEEVLETRRLIKTPIIPKEKLLLPRNLEVRLYNLGLDHVEPWCMVHELYRCFCDCMDSYGEPFTEHQRESSCDQMEQGNSSKDNSHAIKTLNRIILLDTDDSNIIRKKNWHVESFTSDNDHEISPKSVESVKRKPGPACSKMIEFSGMRRKSNDLKRSRVFEQDSEVTPKQPRLQIKTPKDLNLMIEKISQNAEKEAGSLLQEFALSTNSVVAENSTSDIPQKKIKLSNELETNIREQRDSMKRSMRCARINLPYSLTRGSKSKRETQKRLKDLSIENDNPALLKRLQLLVKRSQIVSQQRSLKLGNMINKTVTSNGAKDPLEILPATESIANKPPALIPAPELKLKQQNSVDTNGSDANTGSKVVSMISSTLTPKDQKALSNVVNREILRMLNQKGALDAPFIISRPWIYKFQCLQWYQMLCKYKANKIKLWLEMKPEQSGTMALLTTSSTPPIPNCIDMSTLDSFIANKKYSNIPKFAIKIFADCQKIDDSKHKLQYVFMRACSRYWTLEGVIEKGHKSNLNFRVESKEGTDKAQDTSKKCNTSQKEVDLQTSLLNNELLKCRTEIEATLVDVKDSNNEPTVNDKTLTEPKPLIAETKRKESLAKKKRLSHMSPYNISSKTVDPSTRQIPDRLQNTNISESVVISKTNKSKKPLSDILPDKMPNKRDDSILDRPQSSDTSKSDIISKSPLDNLKAKDMPISENGNKLEALPFLLGMRYLFISMKEKFSLLTSMRNGYRVTYLQLANAIRTANLRNVYVRLKFKQNELNSYERGIVFATPWCKDGVFIGPYGLSEHCMITKQIYWDDKIIGLSEYTRTVEKRIPKPVGYWMCYYGDDKKFVRAYNNLMTRLDDVEKNPQVLDEISANNSNSPPVIKGTSPNSVLKTNIANVNPPQMKTQTSETRPEQNGTKNSLAPQKGKKSLPSKKNIILPTKAVLKLINTKNLSPTTSEPTLMNNNKHLSNNDSVKATNGRPNSTRKDSITNILENHNTSQIEISKITSLQKPINSVNKPNSNNNIIISKNNNNKISPSSSSKQTTPVSQNILNNANGARSLLKKGSLENAENKPSSTATSVNDKDDTSDDEPELIIDEAENEVIDLLSDSEDESSIELGAPGKRWLYCDVASVGYLEAQVLKNKTIELRLPLSPTNAVFTNFEDAASWINTNLRKIVYFLPNSFVPKWTMTTSFNVVQSMKKMSKVLFQGNFVIYNHLLIDLSEQKNIDTHVKNKKDHVLAMKYAEHYVSRYIKHALGLKFSYQLNKEQLAHVALTEIKSILALEAKLRAEKNTLNNTRIKLKNKVQALLNPEKRMKSSILKPITIPKSNSPSEDLIVIDE